MIEILLQKRVPADDAERSVCAISCQGHLETVVSRKRERVPIVVVHGVVRPSVPDEMPGLVEIV